MNKLFNTRWLLTTILFFSTAFLGIASAQMENADLGVKAQIPFAFNAGNTRLPAGDYTIVRTTDINPDMEIRNADDTIGVLLIVEDTPSAMHPQNAELVFDKINQKEFLREVHTTQTDFQFPVSRTEKKLEMKGAKSQSHKITCMNMNMKKSTSAK